MDPRCTFKVSKEDDYRAARDSDEAKRCICHQKGVKHGVQCINCHDFFFDDMTDCIKNSWRRFLTTVRIHLQ